MTDAKDRMVSETAERPGRPETPAALIPSTPNSVRPNSLVRATLRVDEATEDLKDYELITLLTEHGFDLEFGNPKNGVGPRVVRFTPERYEEATDAGSVVFSMNSPTIESDLAELASPAKLGDPDTRTDRIDPLRIRDAGLFSYTVGILGAAAFMASGIGPGWLGFLAGFLPASLMVSWAVSAHA